MPAVRAHAGDGKLGHLPPIAIADLSGSDPELGPNSPEEAVDHVALLLQRMAFGQVKDDLGDAERHRRGHHRFFLTKGGTANMMAAELDGADWGGRHELEGEK